MKAVGTVLLFLVNGARADHACEAITNALYGSRCFDGAYMDPVVSLLNVNTPTSPAPPYSSYLNNTCYFYEIDIYTAIDAGLPRDDWTYPTDCIASFSDQLQRILLSPNITYTGPEAPPGRTSDLQSLPATLRSLSADYSLYPFSDVCVNHPTRECHWNGAKTVAITLESTSSRAFLEAPEQTVPYLRYFVDRTGNMTQSEINNLAALRYLTSLVVDSAHGVGVESSFHSSNLQHVELRNGFYANTNFSLLGPRLTMLHLHNATIQGNLTFRLLDSHTQEAQWLTSLVIRGQCTTPCSVHLTSRILQSVRTLVINVPNITIHGLNFIAYNNQLRSIIISDPVVLTNVVTVSLSRVFIQTFRSDRECHLPNISPSSYTTEIEITEGFTICNQPVVARSRIGLKMLK